MMALAVVSAPAQQAVEIEKLEQLLDERPEEVIERLDPLVRKNPSVSAYLLLAQAWARIDANESLSWLERIFETSPEHQEAWQLWADIMAEGNQYEYAILRLEQQLKRNSNSAYLHLLLAQLYVTTGVFSKAEREFQRTVEVAPEDSEVKTQSVYSLGYLYVTLGRIDEGQRLLRQALDQDRSYLPAITGLAKVLIDTGRSEDARPLLARARELKGTDPEVLLLQGRYHLEQHQSNEAVGVLSKLLQEVPDHAQVHFFLARAYQAEGEIDRAKEHFKIFREQKKARTDVKNRDRVRGLAVQGVK